MIVLPCIQGTAEWFSARLGVPTASCADKILSPTGKPSTQADGYANQLVAERIMGRSVGWEGNAHTQRGTELEPLAREYYEFIHGPVDQVGFCILDNGTFGCSPDGLVGDAGLLEIKCPSPAVHVGYLLGGCVPTGYLSQVQAQLFVTGRKWCDFLSYHAEMPPLLVRVEPNQKWHAQFAEELERFTALLARKLAVLADRGIA